MEVTLGYNVKIGHTPHHAERADIRLKRLRCMYQERVGLTAATIPDKRIMYGALVRSPSCFGGFSGRQFVRKLLRRDRPVIAWCEHVVM